jgi:hypothetical protein
MMFRCSTLIRWVGIAGSPWILLTVWACSGHPLSNVSNNANSNTNVNSNANSNANTNVNSNTTDDCGDGVVDPDETCDGTNLGGMDCVAMGWDEGALACEIDCSDFDLSDCRLGGTCGNGLVDVGEQCDGTNLASEDCTTLGLGFTRGTLACNGSCTWDTAACVGDCPGSNLGVWSGVTLVQTADTCAGTQDYSPPGSGGCTGYNANGAELVYALTLAAGDSVAVTYDLAAGADGALYVLTDCLDTTATTCVAGSDAIGDGGQEFLLLGNTGLASQTFYIVLDNFSGCGVSTLTIGAPPICGDSNLEVPEICDGGNLGGETCQTIGGGFTGGALACNGTCDAWDTSGCIFSCTEIDLGAWSGAPITQSGDTCVGSQIYSPPGGSGCTGYSANGFEVVYGLTLPPLTSVDIVYGATEDNALYVLTDCGDTTAQTCVVGADQNYGAPFSETVTLSNGANTPTHFYLVLDNWTSGSCGPYTLDITLATTP